RRHQRADPVANYLLLSYVAVFPKLRLGRRLLAFAEAEALRRGYHEIRLYTHQTMVENQRLYASIGYEETGRCTEAGYDRVFMRKQLGGPSRARSPATGLNQIDASDEDLTLGSPFGGRLATLSGLSCWPARDAQRWASVCLRCCLQCQT